LIFGLGQVIGAGKQIRGPTKVGDQLAGGRASRGAREKNRIVESTGGEAAPGIGVYRGDVEIGVGEQRRASFPDILARHQSAQFSDRDLGDCFFKARASAWPTSVPCQPQQTEPERE